MDALRFVHQSLMASLKGVSGVRLSRVAPLRVMQRNLLHVRERDITHLHNGVEMVCHETERVDTTVSFFNAVLKE